MIHPPSETQLLKLASYEQSLKTLPQHLSELLGITQASRSVIYWKHTRDSYRLLLPDHEELPVRFTREELDRMIKELSPEKNQQPGDGFDELSRLTAFFGSDIMGIPLHYEERLNGVWIMPELDPDQMEQARRVSPYLSTGLHHRQVTRRSQQLNARLAGLMEEGKGFVDGTNPREMLTRLVHALTDRFEFPAAAVLLKEGNSLRIEAVSGFGMEELMGSVLDPDQGITGRAVREGEIQNVPDVHKDPDYLNLENENVKSELDVPVFIGEEITGLVSAQSPVTDYFTDEDQVFLSAVSHLAAITIRTVRIANRLEDTRDYLSKVIDGTGDAIYTFDSNEKVISWNSGAETIYGYSSSEAVGESVEGLVGNEKNQFDFHILTQKIAQHGGRYQETEVNRRRKDGEVIPVHSSYIHVDNRGGQEVVSVHDRDLTAMNQSTRLEVAKRLISTVSHYINNAVTPLNGRAQIAQMKKDDKNVDQLIDVALDTTYKIQEVLAKISELKEYITVTKYSDSKSLNLEDELRQKLRELEGEDDAPE